MRTVEERARSSLDPLCRPVLVDIFAVFFYKREIILCKLLYVAISKAHYYSVNKEGVGGIGSCSWHPVSACSNNISLLFFPGKYTSSI